MRTAAALIIGNELLSGKVAEANLLVLARTLCELGIRLDRVVMTRDERAAIAAEVRLLARSYDLLVTSGGVGPTHDDVTTEAVADAFEVALVRSPEMESLLRAYFKDRLVEGHLHMARVPEGARLVASAEQPWPAMVLRNVWILPGVPQIFASRMTLLAAELAGDAAFVSEATCTTLDEGRLKPLLDRVVAGHPAVQIGSYPQWGRSRYRTKVTFDSADAAAVRAAREDFEQLLPDGARVEP
ncbi:MAG: competence/damage-inducible protein A [Deltaproteobacteria bacterium]|nr:competence/damage-inducible protein A [Deltaproteobacteria bacterium]